jgi:hypothetical protein
MTSYATVAQLRSYLTQVKGTDAETIAALQDELDNATSTINDALGFSFSAWPTAANKDVEVNSCGRYLRLPAHQADSVTAVLAVYDRGTAAEWTEVVTDYLEEDDGQLYCDWGWTDGWYRIHAIWGYGPAPDSLVRLCLEVAVAFWLTRPSGSMAQGVEGGGAVIRPRALTPDQLARLDAIRLQAGEFGFA